MDSHTSDPQIERGVSGTGINLTRSRVLLKWLPVVALVVGLAGCSGVSEITGPSDDDLLIEKLNTCASDWNTETSDLMFLVLTDDSDVLVTTNPEGECLVVFGGEATGQVQGWIYERDENGYWDSFINSDQPDLDARYALEQALYLEHAESPNAFVEDPVSAGAVYEHPRLRFNPEAPLPASATLGGSSQESQESSPTLDDTGYPKFILGEKGCGDIAIAPNSGYGLFDIDAEGASCNEVVDVLMDWVKQGDYESAIDPEGWTCSISTPSEGMATAIYNCRSGNKEMSFIGG